MDPDGSNRVFLGPFDYYEDAFDAYRETERYSPDGRYWVSTADVYGKAQIILHLPGDVDWKPVTLMTRMSYDPVWSPDGEWIAFVSTGKRERRHLAQPAGRVAAGGADAQRVGVGQTSHLFAGQPAHCVLLQPGGIHTDLRDGCQWPLSQEHQPPALARIRSDLDQVSEPPATVVIRRCAQMVKGKLRTSAQSVDAFACEFG
jgi:hypothetical protein